MSNKIVEISCNAGVSPTSSIAVPARPRLAICFSGNPRKILENRAAWDKTFDEYNKSFDLSFYFHCWSETGLVKRLENEFIEGEYVRGRYSDFDQLVSWLNPEAFSIESLSPEFEQKTENFPNVILNINQAGKRAILSQVYSIERANDIRREFERLNPKLRADVVLRLRFDLFPLELQIEDYLWLVENKSVPVVFVQSPRYHRHPGGGGGCLECERFFQEYRHFPDCNARFQEFLKNHQVHGNDICDLFAAATPAIMDRYASLFSRAEAIWQEINAHNADADRHAELAVEGVELHPDLRIVSVSGDYGQTIENNVHCFYPEKLLRFALPNVLVLHGINTFSIVR